MAGPLNRSRCQRSRRHPVRIPAVWPKALLGSRCTGSGLEGASRWHRPRHPPVVDATLAAGAIPANRRAQVFGIR